MKRKNFLTILLVVSVVLNAWLAYTAFTNNTSQEKLAENTPDFPLLSKRIFVEDPNDVILSFIPLRQALREYVPEQNGKVGVYFEYLPSGVSIGVNEKEEIPIASLSKVPIAMSIMKKIEHGSLSLNNILTVQKKTP